MDSPMQRAIVAAAAGLLLAGTLNAAPSPERHRARSVHITVLSTMLAEAGMGEWGFAALVEVDGRRLLFDTGNYPETVLRNARDLGIDLSTVTDVIVSHHHRDHTGGLLALRRELAKSNPAALSRIHVAPGIFAGRRRQDSGDRERNPMIALRDSLVGTGATFVEHAGPVELLPGVWLTGPVPRPHPEKNWFPGFQVVTADGTRPDTVAEDMSVVINTDKGLVILTGCGHAGVVNIVDYARRVVAKEPAHAVIGGLHLLAASDETLAWTAGRLREAGLGALLGAHCTGIEAVYQLRRLAGLDRRSAVVAAVGSSFDLAKGIDPLTLAR
jgi:7,8-dihydropterin-6-yl-methyl-4-(beta-D-ribofuranosyl)aminobenzene 5'-phosphate synthase